MSRRTKARKKAWEKELNHRRNMAGYMNAKREGLLACIDRVDATHEQRAKMIRNLGEPMSVNHLGDYVF